MKSPTFGTVLNCIDGRVQDVVIDYLRQRWSVDHVDVITEPAPERVLAERTDSSTVARLRSAVLDSLDRQRYPRLALAAHSDCEPDPVSASVQRRRVEEAVNWLRNEFRRAEVLGLWVDETGKVHELTCSPAR